MLSIHKLKTTGSHWASRIFSIMLIGISINHLAWGAAFTGPGPQDQTRFSNIGSIANTRHNMTQSTAVDPNGSIGGIMNGVRNDYGQVCVYCHTPHAANSTAAAPLWNRTIKAHTYATYDQLGTQLTQVIGQPGPASLTCLSCHDGLTAVDSIINMPGSGMADNAQATSQNTTFLDSWSGNAGGFAAAPSHAGLNSDDSTTNGFVEGNGTGVTNVTQGSANSVITNTGPPTPPAGGSVTLTGCNPGIFGPPLNLLPVGYCLYTVTTPATLDPAAGCLVCHADGGLAGFGGVIADFRILNIGTDLTNDHPIGITFPATTGAGTDWNTPGGTKGTSLFFDNDSNGQMGKGEIRTYNGNVECASCHDPHGVPSAGPGTEHNPTFLRVDNSDASAVCLTCHNK